MFEELKKKALKSSLGITIILLLGGFGLAGYMASDVYYVATGYADFEQLEPDEIRNQLVEYDMTVNFGCYLEEYVEDETSYIKRRTTDLYYIVWTGDEYAEEFCYMTVKVPASYERKMEEMADNTYNGISSEPITIRGKIRKLDSEEYDYFVESMKEAGWTEEEIENGTLPYYIDCYEENTNADVGYIFWFCAGLLLVAWGIIRLIKALNGSYLKKLRKDIEGAGYNEAVIESDYKAATVINDKMLIKVGRLMTYFMSGSEVRAIPNQKMVWAYQSTVTHRRNGIKTGTTYEVVIEVEGAGSAFSITVSNEEMAADMLKTINAMFPWVVVGYSNELNLLFRKERNRFLDIRYNTCEHIAATPGFRE